jgi:hypothetical protein
MSHFAILSLSHSQEGAKKYSKDFLSQFKALCKDPIVGLDLELIKNLMSVSYFFVIWRDLHELRYSLAE